MDNNFYGYQNPYQAPYGYGVYGNPVGFQQIAVPTYKSTLTEEEQNSLQKAKPGLFDVNIDPDEYKRALCNHKFVNGQSATKSIISDDGKTLSYCPICGETWDPSMRSVEEVKETVDMLYNDMQNFKEVADVSVEVMREYMPVMKLLKKFPDLYKYGTTNINKYLNQNGMYDDNGGYNVGNMLTGFLGSANYYNGYAPFYQPQAPVQQPNQQYYQQQPGYQPGMMAQANVNPMQAGGFTPNVQNPQFAQQANMMMNPYAPQPMMYNAQMQPTYGVAPQAPVQQQTAEPAKENNDGTNTVSAEVKI